MIIEALVKIISLIILAKGTNSNYFSLTNVTSPHIRFYFKEAQTLLSEVIRDRDTQAGTEQGLSVINMLLPLLLLLIVVLPQLPKLESWRVIVFITSARIPR